LATRPSMRPDKRTKTNERHSDSGNQIGMGFRLLVGDVVWEIGLKFKFR